MAWTVRRPLTRWSSSIPASTRWRSSSCPFVPIDYPTTEQRPLGFTGSAIGVHGPARRVRWLGSFVNTFDTTDGCVGLATDGEMQLVARWIRAHHARTIVIQ